MSPSLSAVPAAGRVAAVLSWWAVSRSALARLRDGIRAGDAVPQALEGELRGLTDLELEAWFRLQIGESRQLACFAVMAAAEALFMSDFRARLRPRSRDPLSKRFRQLEKRVKRRILLDPDVLDAWGGEVPAAKAHISRFRTHLKYRHWIAHGMYWEPKLGVVPGEPEDLVDELGKLFAVVELKGWS